MSRKPILCLDFDGVIHSYESGWKGADAIPDPPVPGALDFIGEAVDTFNVSVHSSRSCQPGGREAMQNWLLGLMVAKWGNVRGGGVFAAIDWPTEKPPALVTIDDRAITFTGQWPSIQSLKEFKPWNKQ